MIIELDTSLLEIIDNISINQLVFLSLVLDKNQKIPSRYHTTYSPGQ